MRVIITGATGMVGEGVLHECLHHPDVEAILLVSRRSSGVVHAKVKEVLHGDFLDLSPVREQLTGYDACFFCLGVSSVGMKEKEYYHLTYELTLHMARILSEQNRDMVFCYISGAGTDSTEKGRSMWARIKGKTENHLMQLNFRKAYMFRPAFIEATKGLKNTLSFYKYVKWMIPVLKRFFPRYIISLREVGLAMIQLVKTDYPKNIIEVEDIRKLARMHADARTDQRL